MKEIKYDLVLIGATGFTGKLVAEYLTKEYGAKNEKFEVLLPWQNSKVVLDDGKELPEWIEYDPETGKVTILKYVIVHDC